MSFSPEFVKSFNIRLLKDEATNCLEWQGYRRPSGHGQVRVNQVLYATHRLAWELANGPIPDGLQVNHKPKECNNPPCCNPEHLYLGTQQQNVADAVSLGEHQIGSRNSQAIITEAQVAFLRKLSRENPHMTHAELAAELGYEDHVEMVRHAVSGATFRHVSEPPVRVGNTRKARGVKNSRSLFDSDDEVRELREEFGRRRKANPTYQIRPFAEEKGVTFRAMQALLAHDTYTHVGGPKFTGRPPKQSPELQARIYAMLDAGVKQMDIKAALGVSQSTISYLKSRREQKTA